jgi:UDP-N-acetylglucosamine transferase subunit ALG13
MILILLGTQNNSFHRLLEEVEKNIENKVINEEVIVQAGYTKFETNNMQMFDLIPGEKLDELQEKANLIITHGGVGSIISSIKKGKKVIAVPRLHEYGEHVNNHQIDIVRNFNEEGYIIGIEDVEQLADAIKKSSQFKPKEYKQDNELMLNLIENFIDENIK